MTSSHSLALLLLGVVLLTTLVLANDKPPTHDQMPLDMTNQPDQMLPMEESPITEQPVESLHWNPAPPMDISPPDYDDEDDEDNQDYEED